MLTKTEAFNIIVQALSDLMRAQPPTMGRAIQEYLQPALKALDPTLEQPVTETAPAEQVGTE